MNTTTTTHTPSPTPVATSAAYVQVPEDMEGATGVQVMWRLHGEVDIDALHDATEHAGLPTSGLPSAPTPHVRTKRALAHAARGNDRLVLPHPKGGYVVVSKSATDDRDLELSQGLRVWWEGTRKEGKLCMNDDQHPDAGVVRAAFARYANVYISEDFGVWLPQLLISLGAVALRESGGVYFVPADKVATWRQWATVIRSVSGHTFYDDIKLLPTHGAVALVLDCLVAEADKNMNAWAKRLNDTKSARGFNTKEKQLTELTDKLANYERLLGVSLDAMKSRAQRMKATVGEKLLELEGTGE